MLVVRVYMWPGGDREKERLLCQATIDNQGVAQADDESLGVRAGERRYRVRLLKDASLFGGPTESVDIRPHVLSPSKVWREAMVRGHRPGGRGAAARGVWDLLGGALGAMLRGRLSSYRLDEGGR